MPQTVGKMRKRIIERVIGTHGSLGSEQPAPCPPSVGKVRNQDSTGHTIHLINEANALIGR